MIKDYRRKYGLTQQEFSRCFDPPIPIDTIKKMGFRSVFSPAVGCPAYC